ncbi:MAG: DUF2889 domain-containing protein [Thermodesulfobacteriota bacterium]|nr:DUF2889 domain-containing protein [Thermodesulfobacteriota bacterium]
MVLRFTRNKHASTIDLEDGSILSRCSVCDTFFEASVEIVIQIPDMAITSARGVIRRSFSEECKKIVPMMDKLNELRIGPGIIKAIEGTVGGTNGCPRISDLVWECCNGVILRFTAPRIREMEEAIVDPEVRAARQRRFIEQNPRLIGTCIAYAEGSPLLQGIKIQKEENS